MPAVAGAVVVGQLAKGKAGKKIWNILKKGWKLAQKGANAIIRNKSLGDTVMGGSDTSIAPTPVGTFVQSPEQKQANSKLLMYAGLGLGAFLIFKK